MKRFDSKPTIHRQGTRWYVTFDDIYLGKMTSDYETWHDAFNFLYRMYRMGYVRRTV